MNSTSDNFSRWEYQNIALAAVAQCAALVHTLATRGRVPQPELIACVNPLLVLNPGSVEEVYPHVADLSLGLRTMQDIFSNNQLRENAELIRYTLGMLSLRNRLVGNAAMENSVRERLRHIKPLQEVDSAVLDEIDSDGLYQQDRIFQQLASLYKDTIGTLSYRIQVQGKVENLKNENVANKIRSILLAGIRSAVLWYQLGGRRWRLLFYRNRIQATAGDIRRKLIAPV
ncbi:MAG: high frequency lysogenization protein HflD [Gammaproteobacteria bacterium]|nr:high frequency lysogenization protein HflD [Gammaproteobacteria bacterium]MDP6651362.1 high frequency lysogenization protein HflD [Gammaproteobacteria bacterium]